jgi:hypothetical protein
MSLAVLEALAVLHPSHGGVTIRLSAIYGVDGCPGREIQEGKGEGGVGQVSGRPMGDGKYRE